MLISRNADRLPPNIAKAKLKNVPLTRMSGARAKIFHEPDNAYPEFEEIGREIGQHSHRTKLPVIPDLRFEYSYLKSIQHFVEVEVVEEQGGRTQTKRAERFDQSSDGEGRFTEEQGLIATDSNLLKNTPHEVIKIQLRSVLWVTMRDQVISPLVQGALW